MNAIPSGYLHGSGWRPPFPRLRARFIDERTHGFELLAPLLARKRGSRTDDLSVQVIGSALVAAVWAALDRWQEGDSKSDLVDLLDQATDALVDGVRDLQPSPQAHDAPAQARRRG